MGNANLSLTDGDDPTPCQTCQHFGSWGERDGDHFVNCESPRRRANPEHFGWKTGCRWWTRQPGADDEPVAPPLVGWYKRSGAGRT